MAAANPAKAARPSMKIVRNSSQLCCLSRRTKARIQSASRKAINPSIMVVIYSYPHKDLPKMQTNAAP